MYNKDTNKARRKKGRIDKMKPTNYTLQKAGCVPYYITDEEYEEFVKIIEGKKKAKLRKVLTEMYDFFGDIRTVDIVEEELNSLAICYGNK